MGGQSRPIEALSELAAGVMHAFEAVSLDVLAGAVGSSLFLLSLNSGEHAGFPVFVAMGAAVLFVYNFDHLLDARKTDPGSTPRRRRYADHKGSLAGALVAATTLGMFSLPHLPASVWMAGSTLAAYLLLYFAGLRFGLRGSAKRLMAAVGWAAGIAIPALCATPPGRTEIVVGTGLLSILAWINLQSYALVDAQAEADKGQVPSFILRGVAITIAGVSLAGATWAYPEHAGHWAALGFVALVQLLLTNLPPDFAHPAGEWSLALLGLFSLAR